MKGLSLALFLLALPACSAKGAKGAHPGAHARRVGRRLHKDLHRIKDFSKRAEGHGLKKVNFAHPAKRVKLDDESEDTTEVEAYYGVDVYDYVVDVGFTDSEGTEYTYPLIMDTGSSNLAVAVESCTNCGEAATTLDMDMYSPTECLEVTYGSGAWIGERGSDDVVVTLGDLSGTASDAVTGIVYQEDFFDSDKYNGIFGLSYQALAGDYSECSFSSTARNAKKLSSTTAGQTLLGVWDDNSVVDSNMFTITYCDETATLSVGTIDTTTYSGDLTYVDVQETFGEYYGYFLVEVTDMTFDGSEVDLDSANINEYGGVLVDSGTTLVYLPSAVVTQLKATLEDDYDMSTDFFEWETCLDESEASVLPDLTVTFSDTYTMTMDWARYLYYYDECYYWGVGASSLGIIGNIAQQDQTILFDLDNNQMAFADAVCSSDDSTTETTLASMLSSTSSATGVLLVAGLVAAVAVFAVVRSRRSQSGYTPVATEEAI